MYIRDNNLLCYTLEIKMPYDTDVAAYAVDWIDPATLVGAHLSYDRLTYEQLSISVGRLANS